MLKITKMIFYFLNLSTIIYFLIIVINLNMVNFSKKYERNIENLPDAQCVIILGAKVYPDGTLSDMLRDRADTAIEVYKSGKAKKILVSADHGQKKYDEVNAIKNYLLTKSIPKEDIFLDHAGFDTYSSLYRAKEIFDVTSAIVTTQNFHLSRAVYIGNSLGIKTYGLSADTERYPGIFYNQLREVPARLKAYVNVLFKTKPKYLGNKIPITGNSDASWDEK
jgi:vancomycin permeability regulator SanA